MGNLYEASAQWATRPDDERYDSVGAMLQACKAHADSALAVPGVLINDLHIEPSSTDLALVGKAGKPAKLTHYSFGQLARLAKAPVEYVRSLPPVLAASCLNLGLVRAAQDSSNGKLSLLFHRAGKSMVTRALTTDSYDRVWNWEVLEKVGSRLCSEGWQVPPARPSSRSTSRVRKATQADILPNQGDFGLSIKVGDDIAPAGLYASDHDMFAFLVNQLDPIWDGQKFLHRGVFVQNSEVGDCALKFKLFTYDNVCGNHIVWGAGDIVDISIRHMKSKSLQRGNTLSNGMANWQVVKSQLPSGQVLGSQIAAARKYEIADTKENVIDTVFKFGKTRTLHRLTKNVLTAAYDVAEKTPRYGSPRTVWGLVNGLTEYSQTSSFADERNALDVQAGRILEMAI